MSWSNFDNTMQNQGGFMDATVTEGAGTDDKNLKRGQNCFPVMIEHIRRYGEELTIWGTPAKIVTFVAIINKIEATATKVSFEFQDETGTLKGLKWLEGDGPEYQSPVRVKSYVRVHGLIRDQAGEPYILVIHMRPVQDMNEIMSHLAEVTFVMLQGEKYHNQPTDVAGQAGSDLPLEADGVTGLKPLEKMVLNIIQNSDSEYGAERAFIKTQVPPNVALKIDEVLDFLSSEGHIYTTKTDDFFKAI